MQAVVKPAENRGAGPLRIGPDVGPQPPFGMLLEELKGATDSRGRCAARLVEHDPPSVSVNGLEIEPCLAPETGGPDQALGAGRAKRSLGQAGQNNRVLDQVRIEPSHAPGTNLNPALALLTPGGNGLRMSTSIDIGDGHGLSLTSKSSSDTTGDWTDGVQIG